VIICSPSELCEAKVEAALLPQPCDGKHDAFERAAKIITAFHVEQNRLVAARPPRRLTDDEFDDEQARINNDWFIR
jgi:hypothetical protein